MEYSGICGLSTGVFTRGNACWLNDNMIGLFVVDDCYVDLYGQSVISLLRFDSVKSIVNRHFVEVSANMISWSKVASQTTASSRNYAWVVSPGSCWLTQQTERCGRTSCESRSLYREMLYPVNIATCDMLKETTVLTWRRFSNAVANSTALLLVTNEAYYALDADFALQKRRVFARGTIAQVYESRERNRDKFSASRLSSVTPWSIIAIHSIRNAVTAVSSQRETAASASGAYRSKSSDLRRERKSPLRGRHAIRSASTASDTTEVKQLFALDVLSIVSDIYDFYLSIHAFKSNYLVVPVWRVIRHGSTQALYRREPFDRDLRLIKSHIRAGRQTLVVNYFISCAIDKYFKLTKIVCTDTYLEMPKKYPIFMPINAD
ncbi:hypothetical protein G5I_06068 [Acromyrmex echinatior]|uniref:Uncharacterized protein n=1 Tax=Acromyrmex echinatior TaxID=103372 RepID=F4WK25_ACREC|nr:hypothetical protein G5I_06068 [Acromyrmex echinatior]